MLGCDAMGVVAALRTIISSVQLSAASANLRSNTRLTGSGRALLNEHMPFLLKTTARVCCLSTPYASDVAKDDVAKAKRALVRRQSPQGSNKEFYLPQSLLESEPFRREVISMISKTDLSSISRDVQLVFEMKSDADPEVMCDAAFRAIKYNYLNDYEPDHKDYEDYDEDYNEDYEDHKDDLPIAQYLTEAGVDEMLAMLIEINIDNYLLEKERSVINMYKRGKSPLCKVWGPFKDVSGLNS